jgi:hypothetical protein
MKCDKCKNNIYHQGGVLKKFDDLFFHYCAKEHWEIKPEFKSDKKECEDFAPTEVGLIWSTLVISRSN